MWMLSDSFCLSYLRSKMISFALLSFFLRKCFSVACPGTLSLSLSLLFFFLFLLSRKDYVSVVGKIKDFLFVCDDETVKPPGGQRTKEA